MPRHAGQRISVVCLALVAGLGARVVAEVPLVVCDVSRAYPDAQTVAFEMVLSRPPDFISTDGVGRQADAFQIFINGDNDGPPLDSAYAALDSLVRGAEFHIDHDVRVRSAAPPDTADPDSGGWGALRGSAPATLVGRTLSFSLDVALVDEDLDGQFTWRVETYHFGAWEDCLEFTLFDNDTPVLQGCGPPITDCNANGLPDACELEGNDCTSNGILDECEPDCNLNGTADVCELAAGSVEDCTSNGVPDICEPDCNTNGVADSCDIAAGLLEDCTGNGIPDICEPDCNTNGVADSCDIAAGLLEDCTGNGIPDICEPDCNTNGVADSCDILLSFSPDCELSGLGNGIPDECEPDCDSNGVADSCDVALGVASDCNANDVPDACELAGNDCNTNGIPDDCDRDCNTNGIPDDCELAAGSAADCNTNGVPDDCDLAGRCVALDLLYGEDFEAYADGDGPDAWLDTGTNNSLVEQDDLFAVVELDGERVLSTASEAVNIHSHYVGPGSTDWTTYEYRGRMRVEQPNGGIGVTFYSDYPDRDAYYRLRRLPGQAFHINPHGTTISGGATETGVEPQPGVWYAFRVHVETTPLRTEIRARLWPEGSVEPVGWMADCFDESINRLTAGRVGAWSMGTGRKHWDGLEVRRLDCDADCDGNGMLDSCEIAAGSSEDYNGDGVPDDCDPPPDADGDGIPDEQDNCPTVPNPGQVDSDGDGWGDVCDGLFDGDHDGDIDLDDFAGWVTCAASGSVPASPACQKAYDADGDTDVDVADFGAFQIAVAETAPPRPGDLDRDRDIDLDDYTLFTDCLTGPGGGVATVCRVFDMNADLDVDLDDFAALAAVLTAGVNGVQLSGSQPDDGESLWRSGRNVIRLTFADDVSTPGPGDLLIQEMLEGGAYGADLSNSFTFTVEDDVLGRPRVLRINETAPTLTHRTWVAVRNVNGRWSGVANFLVGYVVQMGDVDNDGQVLSADISAIVPKLGTVDAADDERADVDGDGFVLVADISVVIAHLPSAAAPRPGGH